MANEGAGCGREQVDQSILRSHRLSDPNHENSQAYQTSLTVSDREFLISSQLDYGLGNLGR